ncbi:substrate-binding domain-containing protein [Hyphomicrobium sp.]|uniref:substrate-binding domain-containing protein n=1 Tax=Hyphomicrobium sp. TaxID=82 RepID=UPI000FA0D6D7|nr:substrate-binding domain-containing protein [Hyphomicrobium sp.]MBN9247471.1 substrate-binding domain-containing protein [Hyphomicrobium sp.]RUP10502.1 MAG: quinoprotein dehydrogenase-associated putative ABC transporter substrate-binding protein [Hyphomicrobium sp.]
MRKQALNISSIPTPALALGICAAISIFAFAFPSSAADAPKADLVNRQQLRVCADPADLPFSNQKEEGFENKIANIIGDELKLPVVYTWFPKATGFVRMTLGAKRCDLVIGWGQGDDLVLNTNAIYRSTSALIYKKGTGLDGVDTLADPRLQGKKFGVQQGSAGGTLAAHYGLMSNVHGYPMMVDRRYENPAKDMVDDIRKGDVDAGILWGPIAAYWAARDGEPLVVVPLVKETGASKIAFRITMGVRNGDDAWKRQLNDVIRKRQGDIDKVLLDYGVPLLVDDDTSTERITKPRTSASAEPAPAGDAAAAPSPAPASATP